MEDVTEDAGCTTAEAMDIMREEVPSSAEEQRHGSQREEEAEEEEEAMCRYCLGGPDEEGGNLISPCKCAGGQKYVHLSCLRRWQRMVLVSQPTHPAYYERDERQYVLILLYHHLRRPYIVCVRKLNTDGTRLACTESADTCIHVHFLACGSTFLVALSIMLRAAPSSMRLHPPNYTRSLPNIVSHNLMYLQLCHRQRIDISATCAKASFRMLRRRVKS